MDQSVKEQLEKMVSVNGDLQERMQAERWTISYDRRADMIRMGGKFPKGTFYLPLGGTRVMVRIDKNHKIYGYAIENAKAFIKENPEEGFLLSFVVYPIRSFLFKLPYRILMYHTIRGIRGGMEGMISISNYVAGKAAFS